MHQMQNGRFSEKPEPEQFNDSLKTRVKNYNYFEQRGGTDGVNII